jgi:hypothetical protein
VFDRNWEAATAKIVAKKFKEGGERSGVWEYVADVTPASGEAFRTTLKQPPFMSHVVQPTAKDRFNQALNQPPGSPPPG